MKVIGLTGGIGMGKSTAGNLLRERHVRLVDTDLLARQLVEPGQAALAEIQRVFSNNILSKDGRLLRDELARRVFSDPDERRKLESILHPRIRELWLAQLGEWRRMNVALAAVVIPLLFETGAESQFDAIICVACTAITQHERLLARGMTPLQIQQRVQAQWPIEQKISRSDYVVWTEGSLPTHAEQLDRILGE